MVAGTTKSVVPLEIDAFCIFMVPVPFGLVALNVSRVSLSSTVSYPFKE